MRHLEADAAIIGAGPVGLAAVFALGQVGLSAIVIDALTEIGGQCTALYPEKPIYDIPGRSKISAADLVDDLARQAALYSPRYLLGRQALAVADADGHFDVSLSDGSAVQCGAVIVAAGAGAFGPNRPPLPGIESFEGRSVHYFVRSPEAFRDRHIVIAGGGDSAADWSVHLADVAASVTIVHRRRTFRAAPSTLQQIATLEDAGQIAIRAPRNLIALEGTDGSLHRVIVADEDGVEEHLVADALLCFFGLAKDLSAVSSWGLGADRNGIPVEPATMQTRRKGVFAIGDIATYPGKLKLIVCGFSEAALAAHAARAYLHPGQVFHFEYSTSRGQPSASKEI